MTFPLHVETYRIGNRCYRRNPYKPAVNSKTNNDVGDTPDLYPEEDEAEDGPSCAYIQEEIIPEKKIGLHLSESEEAAIGVQQTQSSNNDCRITIEDNCWVSKIEVPIFLHGKLIGMQGKTLRQLEDSTTCRIKIPRRGQKGSIEIKSSIGFENVRRCLEQIEVIVKKGKENSRFTHFTAFPCNQKEIIETFTTFRDSILSSEAISESVKDKTLFVRPNRLHLTLTMLWIFDITDEVKAKLTLENAGEDIRKKLACEKIIATIKGLSIMNDDPSNVDVLYANITGKKVQECSNIVYEHMVDAGLSPKVDLSVSTTANPVKLHMTLINSRKKSQKFGTKREAFDASTLLELYKNYYFGTVVLNRISICKLNSGENDNYYDELASINLG